MIHNDSGSGGAKATASAGQRPSLEPRFAVRVAPDREDNARCRRQDVDGLNIVALGQRHDGIAHGPHQGRVRAREDLRDARAGRPGDGVEV